jgi:Flp pilus assembly protein TadB
MVSRDSWREREKERDRKRERERKREIERERERERDSWREGEGDREREREKERKRETVGGENGMSQFSRAVFLLCPGNAAVAVMLAAAMRHLFLVFGKKQNVNV